MHFEQTIIQKCFALPELEYAPFIQGDINKYTVMYFDSKLFEKSIIKNYQSFNWKER